MYKNDNLTPLRIFTAHSGYLHLAVEMGLIGISLIVLFALTYFKKIITVFNKGHGQCYLVSAMMVGVVAFMIHECVETNLLIPPVAIPFFGMLALSLRISDINFDVRK